MRKILSIIILALVLIGSTNLFAQEAVVKNLTQIDPEIRGLFPRWKICEPDIQIQVHRAFVLLGYDKTLLSTQKIIVLAAPKIDDEEPYELLMITCGDAEMNSVEIEANLSGLAEFITGSIYYQGDYKGERTDFPERDYCYEDIPPAIPPTKSEAKIIKDFFEPDKATHAVTLSLFEQGLKLGNTGIWFKSKFGTDEVGYQYWSSGEAKILFKRPLYANNDPKTSEKVPYLIMAHLGGGYRHTAGINHDNTAFSWVPERRLNVGPGGKVVAGLDFHMPFHPNFGIHMNAEIPLQGLTSESVDQGSYGVLEGDDANNNLEFVPWHPLAGEEVALQAAPLLRGTGQITLFYDLWLDENNPENYFRLDAGISYCEVEEVAFFRYVNNDPDIDPELIPFNHKTWINKSDVTGFRTWKNSEFGDWLYLKGEYRNQAAFPFGVSLQYSNQILLARAYIPLAGDWLYIEGKYSTPLRGRRPYEIDGGFFMISPVIRITI
jgi:hypothetical protein